MLMAEETVPMALGITDPPFTPKRWSAAEYDALVASGLLADLRLELLDGVIVEITPPGGRHIDATAMLTRALVRAVGDDAFVSVQNPLACGPDRPQPDLAVVPAHEIGKGRAPSQALLVIEIADSSVKRDRLKAEVYARASVPEYWLVDLQRQLVEVWTEPDGDRRVYRSSRSYGLDDTLSAPTLGSVQLPVARIFGHEH
jgi:Uma2 family endonuclease